MNNTDNNKFLDTLASRCVAFHASSMLLRDDADENTITKENFIDAVEQVFQRLTNPHLDSLIHDPSFITQLWNKIEQLLEVEKQNKLKTNNEIKKYSKYFCAADLMEVKKKKEEENQINNNNNNKDFSWLMSDTASLLVDRSFEGKNFFVNPHFRTYNEPSFQELCLVLDEMKKKSEKNANKINDEWLTLLHIRWRRVANKLTVAQNRSIHNRFYQLLCMWSSHQKSITNTTDTEGINLVINRLLSVILDEYTDSGLNIVTFLRAYLQSLVANAIESKSKPQINNCDKIIASTLFRRLMTLPIHKKSRMNTSNWSDIYYIDYKIWTNTQLLLLLWSIYEYYYEYSLIDKSLYFDLIEWSQGMFNTRNVAKLFEKKPSSFIIFGDLFFADNSHLIQYEEDDNASLEDEDFFEDDDIDNNEAIVDMNGDIEMAEEKDTTEKIQKSDITDEELFIIDTTG